MPVAHNNSTPKGGFGALRLRRINHSGASSAAHVLNTIRCDHAVDGYNLLIRLSPEKLAARYSVKDLPKHSIMLINPLRTSESFFENNCRGFSVSIPGPLLRAKMGNPEDYCFRALDATHGAGSILVSLVSQAWREQEFLSESESGLVSAYLVDLLVSLLMVDNTEAVVTGGSPMTVAHKRQALRFIDSHLSDPDLGPDSIAADLKISSRYLHQLLTRLVGKSVSLIIKEKRLEQCRLALVNPQTANRSITQIMMEWGFGNSSHFSRIFKEKYGIAPKAYRLQHRGLTK